MTVHLMNSAMMPAEGIYVAQRISQESFASWVRRAYATGTLKSYIGYEQTARHIEAIAGVPVEVSRQPVSDLQDRDVLLVCKLKYRVADPTSKGKPVRESDFEYFLVDYYEPFAEPVAPSSP